MWLNKTAVDQHSSGTHPLNSDIVYAYWSITGKTHLKEWQSLANAIMVLTMT